MLHTSCLLKEPRENDNKQLMPISCFLNDERNQAPWRNGGLQDADKVQEGPDNLMVVGRAGMTRPWQNHRN